MTPMFKQYMAIKEEYPDAILLFRMGDFYEMFFEDAEEASRILDITLTSRNREKDQKVPMCGVPAHSADPYISKLVKAGKKVAICEQVEDPKKAKGLVKREVIRVLTPGLITEEEGLTPKANNYVAAINPGKKRTEPWGLSYMDLSTGEFRLTDLKDKEECLEEIFRLEPAELLLPEEIEAEPIFEPFLNDLHRNFAKLFTTRRPFQLFKKERAERVLVEHFKVKGLEGFGISTLSKAIGAAGALLLYAKETQKAGLSHIEPPRAYHLHEFLIIDEASKRNLELVSNNIDGGRTNTLLSILDQTLTPMGGRLLKRWILYPLIDPQKINHRLDAVEFLCTEHKVFDLIRSSLKRIHDLERLLSRAVIGTINPRELLALRESLRAIPEIKEVLSNIEDPKAHALVAIEKGLNTLKSLRDLLYNAIREDAPQLTRDGRIIKKGFNRELDEIIELQENAKSFIAEIEARERERTQIPNLKIGFNKVFGYYLEVTKTHKDKVPQDYIRKQTLVNAERYITQELKELEEKILSAQERRITLEQKLFDEIKQSVVDQREKLQENARLLAKLDCLQSLSAVAQKYSYKRPIVSDGDEITLKKMRHPVIENVIGKDTFVPNDIHLDDDKEQFIIITGPNMAGKSTVLRSTALNVLMAQMGSFVPCEYAAIGIVDRIFTRVGATDYLSRGQSTFMVEMSETANILHNATPKSLVILDEIGRGTSTYDGLAIAWAVSEELLKIGGKGVKTLFATHYHELTRLEKDFDRVKNLSVAVKEWGEEIIFLYTLKKGPANKSYGIHVAALAGIPRSVVERAQELLEKIENSNSAEIKSKKKRPIQMSLPFECPERCLNLKKVGERIQTIDINNTTPLEALNFLAMLKGELKSQ